MRLHAVLDPFHPLLQLDDLLGHAGELAPRGEVEGDEQPGPSPARPAFLTGACAASICSSERPIIWAKPSVFMAWPSTRDHASIH